MSEERIFPLIKRKTPILDRIRGNPVFKERPLFGILAETPEEIRSLRRGVVAGFASALAIAAFLPLALRKVSPIVEKAAERTD